MQAALYVATVLASVFGALYSALPTPVPVPGPVIVQPVPPAPIPAPLPQPNVSPTPTLSIVDSRDQPVTNNVDAGRILNVSCPEGFRIFGLIQPMPSSGDISHISPTRLQVALVPGGLVQIFMYNMTDTPSVTIVRCNQAPQPPPNTQPQPQPQPQPVVNPPAPTPTGKVIISIIEDAPNRPPAVVKVLNDFTYWESLRKAGHIVRIWNGAQPTASPEADAQADIAIVNGVLPSIVIRRQSDRSLLYSGKLPPTADETKTLVSRYVP
jgi:hypothetical protein